MNNLSSVASTAKALLQQFDGSTKEKPKSSVNEGKAQAALERLIAAREKAKQVAEEEKAKTALGFGGNRWTKN